MSQNPSHIEFLFRKFSAADASEEEVRELFALIAQDRNDPELIRLLENEIELGNLDAAVEPGRKDRVMAKIREVIGVIDGEPTVPAKRSNYKWLAVAAAVAVMVIGAGLFYYYDAAKELPSVESMANDVAPGKQGATLTLASGKQIRLSEATNGELAKEAGVSITKSADGQLIYEVKDSDADANNLNTLSTANGETYQVKLPDGSMVYLNASSSLTYAASLIKDGKRVVKLTGEGYFEVFKDKAHPFVVKTDKQEVEVLGTHFNINAYTDEGTVKTTLLEGSVKINETTVLKPGQQSVLTGSNRIKVENVNTDNIVDWKEDDFVFNGDDFKAAMRKIARWYDVEIVYASDLPQNISPGGWISRNNKISAVLKMIEATGQVHFKIEGRRILVTK